jgi:inosine-uridine nucleoside N-ribohydrolase
VFLVNVASYEQYWIQADPEAVEFVVSAAAEMVRIAANAGRQIGLVTNGLDNLTHERPRSALGRGPHSLTRALEILARLGPYAANSPEAVFLGERGRLPWGATLVVVTPKVTTGLASAMLALRRAHHRVLGISIAPADADLAMHLRARGVVLDVLHQAELRRAG